MMLREISMCCFLFYHRKNKLYLCFKTLSGKGLKKNVCAQKLFSCSSTLLLPRYSGWGCCIEATSPLSELPPKSKIHSSEALVGRTLFARGSTIFRCTVPSMASSMPDTEVGRVDGSVCCIIRRLRLVLPFLPPESC